MPQCTCTSKHHDNHPGKACDKAVNTTEAYCQECRDREAKERADTAPDLLAYRPRK